MSQEENDIQLRVRPIENGWLLICFGRVRYFNDIDEVCKAASNAINSHLKNVKFATKLKDG